MPLLLEQLEARNQLAVDLMVPVTSGNNRSGAGESEVGSSPAASDASGDADVNSGSEATADDPTPVESGPGDDVGNNEGDADGSPSDVPAPFDDIPADPDDVTPAEAALTYQAIFNSSLASTLLSGLAQPGMVNEASLGNASLITPSTPVADPLSATQFGYRPVDPFRTNLDISSSSIGLQDFFLPLRATSDLEFKSERYLPLDFLANTEDGDEEVFADYIAALDVAYAELGDDVPAATAPEVGTVGSEINDTSSEETASESSADDSGSERQLGQTSESEAVGYALSQLLMTLQAAMGI